MSQPLKKLNFGCGIDVQEGFDNLDYKNFDFNKFPYPVKDNHYDFILVKDVLEHMDDPIRVLEELHRIGKPNSIIKVISPYYHSNGAFNCMQHKHFFNKNSFLVFDDNWQGINKSSSKHFKVSVKLMPTRFGKIFPKFIREQVSFILGEVYSSIEAEMTIIK